MNPKILSEITGSTHGIRFRMKPPIKPKRRNLAKPSGIGGVLAAVAGAVTDQELRPEAFSFAPKTRIPLIADTFLSAVSTGIRKVILPAEPRSVLTCPTTTFSSGRGKKSAAG